MAERRMFAKSVVLADGFLDLPNRTKNLYFMLGMTADDEGFVNNPKSILRQAAARQSDLQVLEDKGYVFVFDSGVVLIRHWKVHNYIRAQRLRVTACQAERAQVDLQGSIYVRVSPSDGSQVADIGRTQDRVGQDRSGKDKLPRPSGPDACAPIIALYNRVCVSLTPCMDLTQARERAICRWLEKGKTLEDFRALFERAQGCGFLKGEGPRGFVAGIDWLLKESNMMKVLEGSFDDRQGGVPKGASGNLGEAEIEAIAQLMAKED